MNENEFIKSIKKLGIEVDDDKLSKLNKYYEMLIDWNEKINLTRITEKKDVYLKHFYDSLTIKKVIDLNNYNTLLDFGTGAGFPGIVLKIFYPNLKVTLVDSLNKRVNFLKEVIKELNLKEIEAYHERVEDMEIKHYDVIVTRAVGSLDKLLKYTHKLIDKETLFIPMKSHVDDEIELSKNLLKKYNLKIEKKETFYLPIENSLRNILIIKSK